MTEIFYDGSKLAVFEKLRLLCVSVDLDKAWMEELWSGMLEQEAMLGEFIYYLKYHTFQDQYKVMGYSLTDLYIYQMDRYQLLADKYPGSPECSRERLVLKAFWYMMMLIREPDKYLRRMQDGRGRDIL